MQQTGEDNYKGLAICITYGVFSISITFFNKAVLSFYGFPYSNTLTLAQMFFTLIFLVILRYRNIPENPPRITLEHCKKCFLLALSFALMAITGLSALSYVNVPVFSALRRGVTLIVMVGEYFFLNKRTNRDEQLSIYLMVVGAVVAGWGDMMGSFIGYTLTIINCVVTAGYLVFIKKTSQETKLDNLSLMLYNNMLSFMPVLLVTLYYEYEGIASFTHYNDLGFIICFLMSAVQAFLLNYFIFLCSTYNSPLATSVTGQIKTIVTTVLGLFMFGDVEFSPLLLIGLLISTLASIWYGQIKYYQSIQPKSSSPV